MRRWQFSTAWTGSNVLETNKGETWDSKILMNSGEDEYAGWRFQIGATDVSLLGVASSDIGKATARNETSAIHGTFLFNRVPEISFSGAQLVQIL